MANDVKALPVVAYRWVPSPYWGDYVHSGNPDQADEAEKFGITVEPLVLQSDAESALAELRQRADTAEARLERAKALLRNAGLQLWDAEASVGLRADIAAFLGEGK